MKEPLITVVIPVYNGEVYLRSCLHYILIQDYPNYEVIVVDNNSTDNTKSIITEISKKDKRVKYSFEPFLSRGAARNNGIACAKGKIISMTDVDCVVPTNWLRTLTHPLIYENEKVVMGSQYDITQSKLSTFVQLQQEKHLDRYIKGQYIDFLDTKNFASKTHIIKNIMFDKKQRTSEDFEFALRIRGLHKIRFLKDVKVGHRHSKGILKWLLNTFEKGYWTRSVYMKYKNDPRVKNEIMFATTKKGDLNNYIRESFRDLYNYPSKLAYFHFITGLFWRAGMFWGYIRL